MIQTERRRKWINTLPLITGNITNVMFLWLSVLVQEKITTVKLKMKWLERLKWCEKQNFYGSTENADGCEVRELIWNCNMTVFKSAVHEIHLNLKEIGRLYEKLT